VWEFLFNGRTVVGSGSISQVRPEDKMAADLQNGDIIVLSLKEKILNAFTTKKHQVFKLDQYNYPDLNITQYIHALK
jgi:hypothetical protein